MTTRSKVLCCAVLLSLCSPAALQQPQEPSPNELNPQQKEVVSRAIAKLIQFAQDGSSSSSTAIPPWLGDEGDTVARWKSLLRLMAMCPDAQGLPPTWPSVGEFCTADLGAPSPSNPVPELEFVLGQTMKVNGAMVPRDINKIWLDDQWKTGSDGQLAWGFSDPDLSCGLLAGVLLHEGIHAACDDYECGQYPPGATVPPEEAEEEMERDRALACAEMVAHFEEYRVLMAFVESLNIQDTGPESRNGLGRSFRGLARQHRVNGTNLARTLGKPVPAFVGDLFNTFGI